MRQRFMNVLRSSTDERRALFEMVASDLQTRAAEIAAMMEACLCQCGRKQIRPCQAPDNVPFGARDNAGDKQCGRCTMHRIGATTGHLMKGADNKPAARKLSADLGDCERQRLTFLRSGAFERWMRTRRAAMVGATAELSIGCGYLFDAVQGFSALIAADMFIICSYPRTESMLILAVANGGMAERGA